jgi:catechol 2,3-dioxygenase-like lactoylglutathione lyase family enzyme
MEPLNYVFTHVHVYASNPDATVSWLTDGLGGDIVDRREYPGYPAATQVRFGNQIVQVRGRKPTEQFAEAGPRAFGWDHIGLSVEDLAATLAVLRERGIEPVTDFDNGFSVPDGVAFFRGPDHLWVELCLLEYEPAPEVIFARHDRLGGEAAV